MPRIAIITDTDAALPVDLAQKYGIVQIPILIQFGEESLLTGIEIDTATTFHRIDKEGRLPTTAAPAPGQFVNAFNAAFASGAESLICFNISCEMSATFNSASQAAQMMPGKRIEVVDTRSVAMGQGFMAITAAQAVEQGATIEQAIAAAMDVRERTYLFGALPTLKYIAMSGRVSALAAGMAGLLDIKPVLTLQNGKLELLEKIRTQKKSWNRAVELTIEKAAGRKVERMAIMHVNALTAAHQFADLLGASMPCPEEIVFADMTPGLAVHTGPGMVAVIIVTEK